MLRMLHFLDVSCFVLLLQIKPKFKYYSIVQILFIYLVNLFIIVFYLPRNSVLCTLHL